MSGVGERERVPAALLRDLVALTKPSIVRMCAITTAGGAWLAPGFDWLPALMGVVGASLSVASASAFNMIWERHSDPLMARTRNRPLAAKRISTQAAMLVASALGLLSLVVLALGTNLLTAGLALLAIVGYVLVYTPLKYRTPLALFIGAIPGAMPPLLGWTAITGSIDAGGLALFLILLVWQMPHFIAITLFRKAEFESAGIRCVPVVRGDTNAKIQAVAWAAGLIPVSLLPTVFGVTGVFYGVIAGLLGVAFFAGSVRGFAAASGPRWARNLFIGSLVYLPALIFAMAVDVFLF
ncbi:MAG: protoheme IX farnesyltransferase [Myxococcales bacterium]|nr:heme o synthase [Myxococcales bacterium]MCB9756191.1 protoheme IX farnesyltransferase [Myxococcales bacterium]